MLKTMNDAKDHISVCICTYRRLKLLEQLLSKLENQKTGDLFTYSIVVVDNDIAESARMIVEAYAKRSKASVRYDVEPERGYALVRNRAIANAAGNYVAFMDDDEYPKDDWLYQLYTALKEYKADGMLGPVLPHYDSEPPKWIVKGRLCERKTFQTGTIIKSHSNTRTGNVLLAKTLMCGDANPFDPRFGKTGGEDTDFFKRMMEKGKVFVWCNEAPVWEVVPIERMERVYFLKRALLRGYTNSTNVSVISMDTLKSLTAIMLYTMALPFCFVIGQHVFMNYLIRNCDHIGKMLGTLGISIVKQRDP